MTRGSLRAGRSGTGYVKPTHPLLSVAIASRVPAIAGDIRSTQIDWMTLLAINEIPPHAHHRVSVGNLDGAIFCKPMSLVEGDIASI